MFAYRLKYNGSWLGGTIIVIANTELEAMNLAYEKLKTSYPNDKLEIENVVPIFDPCIVYNWDGDY